MAFGLTFQVCLTLIRPCSMLPLTGGDGMFVWAMFRHVVLDVPFCGNSH
jgi:hypothetical protein